MGSSRNSPSKAERRNDRKQRREAAARQDHRDKAKIREKEIKDEKKSQPKKPKEWKRRDKNGDIILWNAIKISKKMKKTESIIVTLSGRGDKDIDIVKEYLANVKNTR